MDCYNCRNNALESLPPRESIVCTQHWRVGHAFNTSLAVTGCVKTYVMQFSEQDGFEHLHVHLVPRMADQPAHLKGPNVFGYLTDDETRWLPEGERDRLARELRGALG